MIKSKTGEKITAKQKAEELLWEAVLKEADSIYNIWDDSRYSEREMESVRVQVNKLVQRIGVLLHQDIEDR